MIIEYLMKKFTVSNPIIASRLLHIINKTLF